MQDIKRPLRISLYPAYFSMLDDNKNKEIVRAEYIYGLLTAHKTLWNNFEYLIDQKDLAPCFSVSSLNYLRQYFSDFSEIILFFSHSVKKSIENILDGSKTEEDLVRLLKLTQIYYPTELMSQLRLVLEWRQCALPDFLKTKRHEIEQILIPESILLVEAINQDEYFLVSSKDPCLMPLRIDFPIFNESRDGRLNQKISSRLSKPIIGDYHPDNGLVESQMGSPWLYDTNEGIRLPSTSPILSVEIYAAWFISDEDSFKRFDKQVSILNSYSLSFGEDDSPSSLISYTVTRQNIGDWILFAKIMGKNGVNSLEIIPFPLLIKRIYSSVNQSSIIEYKALESKTIKDITFWLDRTKEINSFGIDNFFALSFSEYGRILLFAEKGQGRRVTVINSMNFLPINSLNQSSEILSTLKKSRWQPIKTTTISKVMKNRSLNFCDSIEFFACASSQSHEIPF